MSYSLMETRNIFHNISPLDHRYSVYDKELYEELIPWLSEEATVAACAKAEMALIRAHIKMRGGNCQEFEDIEITPEEVYAEDRKTRHSIRALVNVIKEKAPPEIKALVHLGATSADILDTAFAYRIKGCCRSVILPSLCKLEILLCDLAEKEAETPLLGRTHGQHAIPITVGFAMAEYVSRLGKSILEIKRLSTALKGKLAGAVGAYNAISMIAADPEELERIYLAELGLDPSEYSTQLVEPEYLLRLLLEINTAFGIIANLSDDLRSHQRSEIAEYREHFADSQVGSSTMPQKRNPWNSEHVKSLWKKFMPQVVTFFLDQISEHQRDLTNSASQRFIAEYITGFCLAVGRMSRIIKGLVIDRAKCLSAFYNGSGVPGSILAEPAYILLAEAGYSNAHEIIRKITLNAEQKNLSFMEALCLEKEIFSCIGERLIKLNLAPPHSSRSRDDAAICGGQSENESAALSFFGKPENYRGLAPKKTRELALKYRALMKEIDHGF